MIGCEYFPESTFQLSSESRLPKWITLPPGLMRADVLITMSYYIESAKFTVQNGKGRTIERLDGKVRCREPFQLTNPPRGYAPGYPAYEEITVEGTTEIIEHRKMEPIFYVTDDPVVLEAIQGRRCN